MTNTVFPWTFDATFENEVKWIDAVGDGYVWRDEVVTPTTLTLTFRTTTTKLESLFRPLKSDEEKADVLSQDDGGFVTVDRANGNNTFALDAPPARQPLRQSGDYHVARYEETLVSQDVGEWDVEIEFLKSTNRSDTPTLNQVIATDGWGFETVLGTIATDRVSAEFLGTGADGVERFELITRLTFDQAHVFEAALSRIGGTRVRQVPDETNVMVDDTSDSANTVTVTAPGGTVVADGDYIVTEWESTRINEAFQTVTFTLADAA